MTIQAIMSEAEALAEYKRICTELDIVNLDDICGDDEQIKNDRRTLLQAIRCGLLTFNQEQKQLIQKLVKPLQSGTLEPVNELIYKNRLNMADLESLPVGKGVESLKQMLLKMTNCPESLLNTGGGADFTIAFSCVDFFAQ